MPEVREAQAELARAHGVDAFCYWHYWFAGRRLLERPFREVLESGGPELPFCLGWTNQSWTGVWHGAPDRVLVRQEYPGPADDERHFAELLPAFTDPRYLRVDGRPLFAVFAPHEMPSAARFAERWRTLAAKAGLPGLYLVGFGNRTWVPAEHGFDALVLHQPPGFTRALGRGYLRRTAARLDPARPWRWPRMPEVYRYADVVRAAREIEPLPYEVPCVMPNWDNTPRSGARGLVFHRATPALFRRHVEDALGHLRRPREAQPLLFVKSWNEWAEGNHLEPDLAFGRGWLEALRDALEGARYEDASAPGA